MRAAAHDHDAQGGAIGLDMDAAAMRDVRKDLLPRSFRPRADSAAEA
ncbi:hypothetical protein P368_22410 [Comamonas thiooxydans]|nr:hypothetical protein P369_20985 [Comamonas thiooxydans]KGG95226.1 hypothetical protein P367_21620 [Comamonas thiooxydans]KGG96831.1 hypothetical protein P365_24505 [Comamonas thiooxydans]KGH06208.1 hypothetical protein P368_22410 [Comamonas thiooxydans]